MWTLTALLLVTAVAFGQSMEQKNCSVDGSVLNSVTGAPVLRAHVSVVGPNDSALTDSDAGGKWSVEHLSCGRVTIAVTRPGFLRTQQSSGITPGLVLVANAPTHDVKLKLAPQAVFAGLVLDDQGDPILGAQVSLMTSRIINGVRGIQASNSTNTNDLGEYRFSGLAAGRYTLCANAGGGAVVANGARPYAERCYPGPIDGGAASSMQVTAGYEGRIDFTLAPLATMRVSGVVSGPPEILNFSGVNLVPRSQIARMAMGLSSPVRPDGSFSIRGVPPGSYTLNARSTNSKNPMTARLPLEVGSNDIESIQLSLEPGTNVTGSIKIVSVTGRKIDKPQYSITLRSSDRIYSSGQAIWDDGRTEFTIPGVDPASYRLEFSPPAPFYLKSATLGGRDIAGSEVPIGAGAGNIEVVLSDDGGVVEGDVATDDGPAAAWIFLERDGAPPRNARTDANGHFRIETVPPGDYKVYAFDNNNVEYSNPEWMQRTGKGIAVTVESGQSAQVKLTRQTAPAE